MAEAEDEDGSQIKDKPLIEIAAAMDIAAIQIGNAETFSGLVREFLLSGNSNVRFRYPTESDLSSGVEAFMRRNSDLRLLFRETFADICMLYLLNPPHRDYLEMVLRQVNDINESTCLRFLLSLDVVGCSPQEVLELMNDILDQKFGSSPDAGQEIDGVLQRIKEMNQLLNFDSYHPEHQLKEYINGCWAELHQSCPLPDPMSTQTAAAIYKRIIQPKEKFNYHMILQDIDQSRQDILTDLQL